MQCAWAAQLFTDWLGVPHCALRTHLYEYALYSAPNAYRHYVYVREYLPSTIEHINKLLWDINYILAAEKWIKHLLNSLVLPHRRRRRLRRRRRCCRFTYDSLLVVFFFCSFLPSHTFIRSFRWCCSIAYNWVYMSIGDGEDGGSGGGSAHAHGSSFNQLQ